jgi:short-subunit dehydrogenase involved in D-alanine esterification of teichoic acids
MGVTLLLHEEITKEEKRRCKKIYSATRNERLEYYLADFSTLVDVRRLAIVQAKYYSLNILLNNAGIS